jgi:protease stability complex PrcB-like protein
MHRLLLPAGLLIALLCAAAAGGQGDLWLRKAKLNLKQPKPGREPAHKATIRGEFRPGDLTRGVDPATHDIEVRIGGTSVLRLPPVDERGGLKARSRGRWKYRATDLPRGVAAGLDLDLARGRFKLKVKGADLRDVLNQGSDRVLVELVMRGQWLDTESDFTAYGRRWSFKQGRNPQPLGSRGSMPPVNADPSAAVIIDAGEVSDRTLPLTDFARDEAKWRILWRQHRVSDAPYIDFERNMVVAVFLGQRPTTGYSVVLENIGFAGDVLEISHFEGQPGSSCIVGQAFTTPYVIVRLPRHEGDVAFKARVATYECNAR